MHPESLQIHVGGRASGKTQKMVEWLLAGEMTSSPPYWSRVIISMNDASARNVRSRLHGMGYVGGKNGGPDPRLVVLVSQDQVHPQVRGIHPTTEVAWEDLDLSRLISHGPGFPTVVTLTGEALYEEDDDELRSINDDLLGLASDALELCKQILDASSDNDFNIFDAKRKKLQQELENYQ